MNNKKDNVYSSIIKATGVFGIMQIIRLAISIVTNKFVAIYIGPIGVGIVSLLNNAVNIITSISNFEFLRTATREVALYNDINDTSKLSKTIAVLQKMAIVIGFFGAIISILFSRILSFYTFGTYDRQFWFVLLSIYFLLTSFSNSRLSILQGVNNIKLLAWANIVIAFFTAIGSIIIYYFFKIEGVIWVLLYTSVILLGFTIFFTRKYSFSINIINFKEFYDTSKPIFKFGFFMSLNLIFGQIANFAIKLYLNDNGASPQILGFYEVSSVILINYMGLIFNAMSYDFFPKLTSISTDNQKIKQLVNSQIEIALIFVTPAIILLYLTAPFLIELLYSKEFLNSFLILKFALFSVILKAILFPLGYIILVKGDKKLFFKQALLSDLLNLVLSIVLYNYFHLAGLGMAYVINYLLYGIYIYKIINKEYEFTFLIECKKLIVVNIVLGIIAVIINFTFQGFLLYGLLLLLIIISFYYSYIELSKRVKINLNIKAYLTQRRNKKLK